MIFESLLHTKEKSAAVFAVRRANYTHRRKGVFNAESIEDLRVGGNVRTGLRQAANEELMPLNTGPIFASVD